MHQKHSNHVLWSILIVLLVCAGVLFHTAQSRYDISLTPSAAIPVQTDASSAVQVSDRAHGFYYRQLSETQQQAYDEIFEGCSLYEQQIDLTPVDEQDFLRAEAAVRAEHPEFFWLSYSGITYASDSLTSLVRQLRIPMEGTEADSERKIAAAADAVIDSIPSNSPQYEAAEVIYDWIIDNTDYDPSGTNGGQDLRSVFLDHQSVCAGYAKAFLYLAQKAGLTCIYVTGTAESDGSEAAHAWNLLQINDNWYETDVTWGDPVFEEGSGEQSKNYDYFCVSDDVIFASHKRDNALEETLQENFSYPACTDDSLDWYVQHGASFSAYDQSQVTAYISACISVGQYSDISMRFGNDEALNEAVTDLIDAQNIRLVPALQNAGSFQITYGRNDVSCVLRLSIDL